jgi:hypothetical protein
VIFTSFSFWRCTHALGQATFPVRVCPGCGKLLESRENGGAGKRGINK